MDFLPVKRALLSVTDKSGLPELARFLSAAGVELVSTGGTRKMLVEAGLPVTSVSDVTGFPEILNGRVKTLHPNVHGGILADKDNPEHVATLEKHGIVAFDMVVVNLYAFGKALEKGLPLPEMVEQIDIGGPTLLRASAKNFASILVVPDPAFYPEVMDALAQNGMKAPLALRQKTAAATFRQTSVYDDAIATYLAGA
ncbi:IMP cyclohydrolase [Solidesulfovibrio carbinolicus]|uniref:IMP cyclohydrolase n=1 Tax=Solidesulfovibrio carbinolicus TaxID=296842 RepID=A0A4P6HUU4_9BACT|nr:IMP cyclohydrolase [Solidesulfovibrio carbinolicus]QAZ69278.1 IMP cyclohydrolase [Solidesulfovibrio carbinolicus]